MKIYHAARENKYATWGLFIIQTIIQKEYFVAILSQGTKNYF